MSLPACTGFGESTFLTERLGPLPPTTVLADALLFDELGSEAEEETEAVLVMTVPFAVPLFTFTTSVNGLEAPAARFTSVQTTLPPLIPGVTQLQPAGPVIETIVVLAGTGVNSVALSAALGQIGRAHVCT